MKVKKNLSQNFLIDNNIKKNIIKNIKIKKTDIILEIGSGNGALSEYFINSKKNLLIELDKNLIKNIKKKNKNKIYNENILNFNFKNINKIYGKVRIIGNIPYKISSQIIINLIDNKKYIKDIHIVIQSEIIKKKYNKLIKLIKYHFEIENLLSIKKNSFKPKPKIKSSLIRLIPKINNKIKKNENFKKLLKIFFSKKRKNISKFFKKKTNIEKYININKRAQEINTNDYIRINNILSIKKID